MPTTIVVANSTDITIYFISISVLVLLLFVTLRYALPVRYRPFSYLMPVILYSLLIMYSSGSILSTQPAYNMTQQAPYNYTVFVSQPLTMTDTVFYLGFSVLIVAIAITLIFFFRLITKW